MGKGAQDEKKAQGVEDATKPVIADPSMGFCKCVFWVNSVSENETNFVD